MDQELFLKLKHGETFSDVESTLNVELVLTRYENDNVTYDYCHLSEIGVWLFFKIDSQRLYSIRFDEPFSLDIDGVKLGNSIKEVKNIKGKPSRRWPMPDSDIVRLIYDKPSFVRYDIDLQSGRVVHIFK
ncbi:hypothetical protein MHH28_15620 [Paenibacillus sp. FSL K6-1217]|uniref:hypothetical protein n=1 Tax=Paenibacillus sp. FSL K6-1217 TaxID=2921466 RepID=UPI0032433052